MEKGEKSKMSKKKVSSKNHSRQQMNDYANQNNPNNKAYIANKQNHKKQIKEKYDFGIIEGESYGWCDD